ncbi:AAA family ATPase [Kitasatospora sp. NPDC091257]|uniref:ATP-binding protein n=1 Tax=Kitasatospora sp. NPDC091257 TaxID=3364084 RepID=UPI003824AC64
MPTVSNHIDGTQVHHAVQAGQIRDIHFHPAGPPQQVPRQLAAVSRVFTDREHDVAALDKLLSDLPEGTAPVIAITGPGGVGKSALVSHWGRRHAERYPDGQLLVQLRAGGVDGPTPTVETVRSLLRGLGDRDVDQLPWQESDLRALWRSSAAPRRLLVALEDAVTADQVVPLIPATSTCLVVVTSRSPLPALAALGAHHHQLGPLAPVHAVQLLGRILGEGRVRAEQAAAEALARACEGNPLARTHPRHRALRRPRRPARRRPRRDPPRLRRRPPGQHRPRHPAAPAGRRRPRIAHPARPAERGPGEGLPGRGPVPGRRARRRGGHHQHRRAGVRAPRPPPLGGLRHRAPRTGRRTRQPACTRRQLVRRQPGPVPEPGQQPRRGTPAEPAVRAAARVTLAHRPAARPLRTLSDAPPHRQDGSAQSSGM